MHDGTTRDEDEAATAPAERHPVYRPVTAEDARPSERARRPRTPAALTRWARSTRKSFLVPAVQGDSHAVLDFSEGTVIGTVSDQLKDDEQAFMLIDAPERGLRGLPDGTYLRTIVHVQPGLD